MKKIVVLLLLAGFLSGCSVAGIARKGVEQSTEEYALWVAMFKARMDKMPSQEIAPFVIWVVTVIGEDKERLPREAERMVDKIYATVTAKPDDYQWTARERAELMGSWDRLFLILYEEAYRKGKTLVQKLITAGVL
jgi:hypothetical protein